MRIKSVVFAGAIGQVGQPAPASVEGLAQVAFAGRSNVGKSSLINRVLGRTRSPIARVSQQPGKTQEINFYQVRAEPADFCLVDLPGYGYARVPQAKRGSWQPVIDAYLKTSTDLAGVVQLLDIRHGPSPDDERALAFLAALGLPVLFVLTKADKLRPTRRAEAVRQLAATLGVDDDQLLAVSSLRGDGIPELLESLDGLMAS